MSEPRVTEAQLHTCVDGQLPPDARLEVQAWLGEHPADARRVENYRDQISALHASFDRLLEEPVPPHLLNLVQSSRSRTSRFLPAAAVVASLAVGAIVGWYLHAWHA